MSLNELFPNCFFKKVILKHNFTPLVDLSWIIKRLNGGHGNKKVLRSMILQRRVGLLPCASRTSAGRRNLLTTASSGSAAWLQLISDRHAGSFSIPPGHHARGDTAEEEEEDAGAEEGDGGGGLMMKRMKTAETFAMFGASAQRGARAGFVHPRACT